MATRSIESRAKQVLAFAREHATTSEDWLKLYDAVFGVGGKGTELFRNREERTAFAKTKEYKALLSLFNDVQAAHPLDLDPESLKAGGRILLRVPSTIHAALLREAREEDVSLNQLILSKVCFRLRAMG